MQGRYLYMAMPAIATALAVGLREVAGRFGVVTVVPAALLAALTFAVPFTISRDAFASPIQFGPSSTTEGCGRASTSTSVVASRTWASPENRRTSVRASR